jgi:hypothetical protein
VKAYGKQTLHGGLLLGLSYDPIDGDDMFITKRRLTFSVISQKTEPFINTAVRTSDLRIVPRVEAGSNTSTVALRVVGGDEKGTQCLRV